MRRVCGVTGDAILPFMDALARDGRLRYIPVRQEAAAGFMATFGPGMANLLNGVTAMTGTRSA